MEAGHRCAIPTCKSVPVELAHIVPWSEVQEHTFENLIALCPTCHSRYDQGDIDRLSMKGYKANLAVLTGRYGEMERRILDMLAAGQASSPFRLPGGWDLHLMYLLKDGLIVKLAAPGIMVQGVMASEVYAATPAGVEFIKRWKAAEPVSTEAEDFD